MEMLVPLFAGYWISGVLFHVFFALFIRTESVRQVYYLYIVFILSWFIHKTYFLSVMLEFLNWNRNLYYFMDQTVASISLLFGLLLTIKTKKSDLRIIGIAITSTQGAILFASISQIKIGLYFNLFLSALDLMVASLYLYRLAKIRPENNAVLDN